MKCKSYKCRSIQIAFVIVLYFIPVHKVLFNFFITFLRDYEFALNMEHWEEKIQALFKRFCSNNFLPACFYTLIHLTYFEYFIKIIEILSISPNSYCSTWVDVYQTKTKAQLYKNLKITCNIEASESVKNVIQLLYFAYYSLRFPFLILKIDQNLTDINFFFHQNTEMKSSSSHVLVNFKDFGNFVHVYLLQWWILSYFPPDSGRGGALDNANEHRRMIRSFISIFKVFSPINFSVLFEWQKWAFRIIT